ncbi:SusE domain-containing protein [Winogradskyella sp.]|uniref:SusE domain-containing protein n=1 Tax=Winogradskyella sp. TaxID=1883156 RepID=UPI00263378D8|nr:SusE domain-containing protein [Winogradskyella sp.]
MKTLKYFKYLIVVSLFFGLVVSSCDGPDPEFFADPSSPITLEELDINLIVIDGANPTNPGVTFNWNDTNFNQAVVEGYSVEFSASADFTNPIEATGSNGVSTVTMSMSQLNSAVGSIGLDPLQVGTVYARVISSLGVQDELAAISNVISFDVVPFFNYVFRDFYLVGPASSAGWENNNNNPPMYRDPSNSNVFSYTGFFNGGQPLKVIETRGQWAPQYGEGSEGQLIFRPTEDDDDPAPINDIEALSDGYYRFEMNISTLEFTIESFNEAGSTLYDSMTLQGNGLEGGSVQMTSFSFDPHIWFISNVTLVPGELQFVTNTDIIWAGDTEFSGVATEGSGSIPVIVEDEYEVWFNDLTGDYIMIPLNL